jgi:phosphoribosylaminoimidazolecarboxamide formyltransferase/IMP cyclohydrolase
MKPIRRALISVWRKDTVVSLAQQLQQYAIDILSTGGTATTLMQHGIPVTMVEEVTGFPEMLGGRVKTLHPHIHGGILAQRDAAEHLATLRTHNIPLIDLVVIDLYPFEEVVRQQGLSLEAILEYIDIGGVALLRAAAKNFPDVTVVCDPQQYDALCTELHQHGGAVSAALRQRFAYAAFQRTAAYDGAICNYLQDLIP